MSTSTRRRLLPRGRSARRLPRPGPRLLVGVLVIAAILVGAFFWVRQSSLVAVRRVTITGVSGPDAGQIRGALTEAARGMSTLDLDRRRLHAAVAPYSVVLGLSLHSEVPHSLRIAVSEQVPVAVLIAGGTRTPVASDGALLHASPVDIPLPTIAPSAVVRHGQVTGSARAEVSLLAAAPYALISRIAGAHLSAAQGLTVILRNGPMIVFGADAQLAAKWRSAIDVLASASSDGASYIDVTDPARPAAGAGSDSAAPGESPSTTPQAATPSAPTTSVPTVTSSTSTTG